MLRAVDVSVADITRSLTSSISEYQFCSRLARHYGEVVSQPEPESSRSDPTPIASSEQARWDNRYAESTGLNNVNSLLLEVADHLPSVGQSLDIAGGSGADSIFLASRGLQATLLDISPVALAMAQSEATMHNLPLTTLALDTETQPLPSGPWDVIHIAHYLHRPTIQAAAKALGPEGTLLVSIATVTNLERSDRPPAPFLLERGELTDLTKGLNVLRFDEEWRANGVHEAWMVAKQSTP